MSSSVRRILALLAFSVPPAFIGGVDIVNGSDYGLSLLYLVPIALGGWFYGKTVGVGTALQSAAWWAFADLGEHPDRPFSPALWNVFTRLAIFLTIALGAAAMRADRKRLQEMLEEEKRVARVDALTGLENGRSFRDLVAQDLARAARGRTPISVIYVDIDNFKAVNDRHGHAAGDALLADIGAVLRTQLRSGDRAARLGGDEFAMLLWGAGGAEGSQVAERVVAAVTELGRRHPDARIGASAGISTPSSLDTTVQQLLHDADEAMYEVKRAGKGRVRVSLGPPR